MSDTPTLEQWLEAMADDQDTEAATYRAGSETIGIQGTREDIDTAEALGNACERDAKMLRAAAAELTRLRALAASAKAAGLLDDSGDVRKVLGSLPITADGAIAIPLMCEVYHQDHSKPLDVDVTNEHVVGVAYTNGVDHGGTDYWEYDICNCYSTPEAASAAPRNDAGRGA